jgi:hypothetical protein
MKTIHYISMEVTQFFNEYGDEIEMDIIRYPNEYQVTVNICDEAPPYRDFTATATDIRSKRKAAKRALLELYQQAYSGL